MMISRITPRIPAGLLILLFLLLSSKVLGQDLTANYDPFLNNEENPVATLMNQEFSLNPESEVGITPQNSENMWQQFKYDLGNIFGGMGYTYSRPLHWKGEQWRNFGFVVGGTALVYIVDEEVSDFFIRNENSIPDIIKDFGRNFGGTYNFLFTGATYITGLLIKNPKLRRTGVLLVSSASASGLLQQIMKYPIGRARPSAGKGKATFDPFESNRLFHSFPSGHVMMGATNAHALAKQFKSPWIKAGFYAIGAIPAVSRLAEAEHWPTDVLFGIALGIFTVETIDRYLDRKYDEKFNDRDNQVSWNLNFGPGTLGVTARF